MANLESEHYFKTKTNLNSILSRYINIYLVLFIHFSIAHLLVIICVLFEELEVEKIK
jgi:hypothetical protein